MTMFGYNVLGFGAFSASGPYAVDVLVVAGGASGGGYRSGGGGAGGLRDMNIAALPRGTDFTVTVGGGGSGYDSSQSPATYRGNNGSDSVFSGTGITTITASGGGGGGGQNDPGVAGGSGGGAGSAPQSGTRAGSSGNTPSTSPSQGNTGGGSIAPVISPYVFHANGGGGGSGSVGVDGAYASSKINAGNGGDGTDWKSLGSSYAGGGGGAGMMRTQPSGGLDRGLGQAGGGHGGIWYTGGSGYRPNASGASGNSGSGGGGGHYNGSPITPGAGGSGKVIVRYLGGQVGSGGTVTSADGYTYHTFNSSGTFSSN